MALLKDKETIEKFLCGGKAYLTVVSNKTGVRRTYRIEASGRGSYFVSALNGSDNWTNYMYIGLITSQYVFLLTKGSKVSKKSICYIAFNHLIRCLWGDLSHKSVVDWGIEVYHEGKCGKCGRKLTVPKSIESGFGPECVKGI